MEYGKQFQQVTGIDLDTNAIKYANKNNNLSNVSFVNAPIEENTLTKLLLILSHVLIFMNMFHPTKN